MATTRPDGGRRYSASRGTRAIQAMVEHSPATGGLALWMHHVDVDDDAQLPAPVANDGKTVFYAPRFATLPFEEQIGWVAHETLHVAFRHVQRRTELAGVLGDVDETLFNACADAIVNSTLSHLSWLRLPEGAVHLDTLIHRTFGDPQAAETLLLQWDVERLYRAVDDRQRTPRSGSSRQSRHRKAATTTAAPADSRRSDEGGTARLENTTAQAKRSDRPDPTADPHSGGEQDGETGGSDGRRSAIVRAMARSSEQDLLADATGERPEDVAEATREWAERISRGHAADGSFSMLRTVSADLPHTRTPWAQVLRQSLSRGLLREPELSWSRPARSWLANRGRSRNGRRMPWEPGMVTSKSVPRLALILDVSGSIDDALLARFAGQLNAITRQLEAQIVLIAGDDQVRYEALHGAGRCGLSELPEFAGGGDTDFAPLIAAAATHLPNYVVILTDLQGSVGPAPGFPVLWAVPPAFAYLSPPFGRLLVLAD
ncbi:MAG: VWA-like domain-containing protein [Pseudomonadota bacterium]